MAETAYRVKDGFAVYDKGGIPRVLRRGDFVRARDPLVKTHMHFLEPMSQVIEQTTAAPGERRSVDMPSSVTNEEATKARDVRNGPRNK
jgi:hypothetical protein